jgi:hypothetical protein
MIIINKFEPTLSIHDTFLSCRAQNNELCKIFDFIDLPENIKQIEQNNSAILRNYYANALDNNLVDIKTVKYIVNKNLVASGINERAIYQYHLAEKQLTEKQDEPISLSLFYQAYKTATANIYHIGEEINLFNSRHAFNYEKLNVETEIELENIFDFLNNDTEFHPILQAWMLQFKMLSLPLFKEGKSRLTSLMFNFWLKKHKMNLFGLLSAEHDLYINKTRYFNFFFEHNAGNDIHLDEKMSFGLKIHMAQLAKVKQLLKTYFRKQINFEKLNPRQKNIMNYVFEHGYKLKEIDDAILNKRQKLIMYIVQHKGFISTKELVSEFDCNRKTIQRDFNLLLVLGLVKSIGAGAGLRYCVNLSEKKHTALYKYQAEFAKATSPAIQDYE